MLWLLGGSYLATCAALILVGVWEARHADKPARKGQATMQQRKVTVWVCEECVMIYHNPLFVCPDCEGEMKERTFANSSQLNVYLINTEIEQFKVVLQRRMPGMTITFDDAFYFHAFEHRNECTIFARCCEADPVGARYPSPVDREQASARRLEFARWLYTRGRLSEFPED